MGFALAASGLLCSSVLVASASVGVGLGLIFVTRSEVDVADSALDTHFSAADTALVNNRHG